MIMLRTVSRPWPHPWPRPLAPPHASREVRSRRGRVSWPREPKLSVSTWAQAAATARIGEHGITVRKTWIDLRMPQDLGDVDKNVRARKAWEQWATRELGRDWKKITKPDNDIYDKYGERRLEFTELPLRFECFYETTDPLIAAYIRQRMAEPAMSHIFEEAKPMMATLPDGTEIEVMPVTREGQMAAAAQGG